jgi:hypothetical protein
MTILFRHCAVSPTKAIISARKPIRNSRPSEMKCISVSQVKYLQSQTPGSYCDQNLLSSAELSCLKSRLGRPFLLVDAHPDPKLHYARKDSTAPKVSC